MLETFKIDSFCEGDVFKVFYDEDKSVEMTLAKIYQGQHKTPFLDRSPFAWVFKTENYIFIEPGCYTMSQEKVGQFEMTINPVVPLIGQENYHFYEAVFS